MRQTREKKERIIKMESINAYCRWMWDCEKCSETVQKYRYYLVKFMEYSNETPVSKDMVQLWKIYLRESLAPVTVNGALAAINGYFKFCGWLDLKARLLKIKKNPFCSESRELSIEEYKRLVQTAMRKGDERLALLIQTLCVCGIRISELLFITVEAIQKGRAEVECKGSIRTVLLTRQLCSILLEYAERKGITTGAIFITRSGRPLNRSNVWREMKKLSEEAKVGWDKVFPHNLRHLFAKTYYAVEKDLSKLADILGHRNIETTRIYTRESGSKHREQLENLPLLVGPYNGISLLL